MHSRVCTKPQINQLNYKADKCSLCVLFFCVFYNETNFFVCTKLLCHFFTLWFTAHKTIVVRLCLGSMPRVVNTQGRKRKTKGNRCVCHVRSWCALYKTLLLPAHFTFLKTSNISPSTQMTCYKSSSLVKKYLTRWLNITKFDLNTVIKIILKRFVLFFYLRICTTTYRGKCLFLKLKQHDLVILYFTWCPICYFFMAV